MLTSTNRYVSPDVEKLIKEVILEDTRYERELRSVHREKIVLPANIKFMNGIPSVAAFTRNLSVAGTCLISRAEVEVGAMALVQIYRLTSKFSQVVAECKWTRQFGEEYWMSGWQFLRLPGNG